MTAGQKIAERRRAADLTQAVAAERAEMTQPQWSRYERDGQSPSVETLKRIASAIGCRADELL